MNDNHNTANNRYRLLRHLRTLIQPASFILFPGLFISVFSSILAIAEALAAGTFSFSAYAGTIILLFIVFAVTLIWGRYFCGFFCAFGALQDFMWFLGEQISKKSVRLNTFRKKHSHLHWIEKNDSRLKKSNFLFSSFRLQAAFSPESE